MARLKEDGVGYAQNQFNKDSLADVQAKIDDVRTRAPPEGAA